MRIALSSFIDLPNWAAIAHLTFADATHQDWLAATVWMVLLGTRVVLRARALRHRRLARRTATSNESNSPGSPPDHARHN